MAKQEILMKAIMEDSKILKTVLDVIMKYKAEIIPLKFTNEGLEIYVLDASHTFMMNVLIKRVNFKSLEGIGEVFIDAKDYKNIKTVTKLLKIGVTDRHVKIKAGKATHNLMRVEGGNIEKMIPKAKFVYFDVNSEELSNAIDQLRSYEDFCAFRLENGILKIISGDIDKTSHGFYMIRVNAMNEDVKSTVQSVFMSEFLEYHLPLIKIGFVTKIGMGVDIPISISPSIPNVDINIFIAPRVEEQSVMTEELNDEHDDDDFGDDFNDDETEDVASSIEGELKPVTVERKEKKNKKVKKK